ncbi:alpha/beta hydrolase fold domain-containing protein [bacterium]|nr:alpha/beta hydrolase fold domain-containing protein [bacterium]
MTDAAALGQQLVSLRRAYAERFAGINPADVGAFRAMMDAHHAEKSLPPGASTSPLTLGGVPAIGLLPKGGTGERVLFWLHGGGYMVGSSTSGIAIAGAVAHRALATAVAPDYRLAPEHPYPAAVDDAESAYLAVLAEGVDPGRIVVCGDSAGGGLAVALARRLVASRAPRPAGLLLISPWVNLTNNGWSYSSGSAATDLIDKPTLDGCAAAYLAGRAADDPEINPLCGDLGDLPPTYIQVGGAELLLSDSTALAEVLGAAGSPVTLEVWPHMFHVFQDAHRQFAPARQALERAGDWAAAHMKP